MAAPVIVDTSVVTWASGADPAAQNITIPSDATAVYLFWAYWASGTGTTISGSPTLGGESPDQGGTITGTDSTTPGGVHVWYNPPTGEQAIDIAWTNSPGAGPVCIVVYTKNGDTASWRDQDITQNTSPNDASISVTLTTEENDLVLKWDVHQWSGGIAPPLSSGWTNGQTASNNNLSARFSYISATGVEQLCEAESEFYSVLVALAISSAAASATALPRRALSGPFYGSLRGSVR
jgi:hypothetical protein